MYIVSEEAIRVTVSIADIIDEVERAFGDFDRHSSGVFTPVLGTGTDQDHLFTIKSGWDSHRGLLGLKVGGYCPFNKTLGNPAHFSTVLLFDEQTNRPLALIAANYLNCLRTAAADAVAVRHLANSAIDVVSVIGLGHQALFEIEAITHVRDVQQIMVAGRSDAQFPQFAKEILSRTGLTASWSDVEAAAKAADVIVTATTATTPIIKADWVRKGTHISAMGADSIGKQELDPLLFSEALVSVDHPPQAKVIGESQHAYRLGLISDERLEAHTLGAIVNGRSKGREDKEQVTIFDSSGIAIQDLAAAHLALKLVREAGLATKVDF